MFHKLYVKLFWGKEKAWVGGISSFVLTLLAQYNINQNVTSKEFLTSIGIGVLTHLFVYLKTNSQGA